MTRTKSLAILSTLVFGLLVFHSPGKTFSAQDEKGELGLRLKRLCERK